VTFDDSSVRQYSIVNYATSSISFATATPYVMNQLFGSPLAEADITSPRLVSTNLVLPATVEHGTVAWTSSDTAVITNAGVLTGGGFATITARVTFDNGTQKTYSMKYYSAKNLATGGLLLRAVNAAGYLYNGSTPSDTSIDSFLTAMLFDKTPFIHTLNQYPNFTNAAYPAGLYNGSGLLNSLISYSGFLVPSTTGSYTINASGDDSYRLSIMKGGAVSSVAGTWGDSGGKSLTLTLEAGKAYPIWLFFRGSVGWGTNSLKLQWQPPGAGGLSLIPAANLASTPDALVTSTTGYPQGQLPFSQGATSDPFNTGGVGLQLRAVDLTSFTLTNTASGMDHYINSEVLNRTPLYTGTALPNWTRTDGSNHLQTTSVPSVLRNASNYVKESLWVYSGTYLPKVSGSHQFKITADDDGRLFVGGTRRHDHHQSDGRCSRADVGVLQDRQHDDRRPLLG